MKYLFSLTTFFVFNVLFAMQVACYSSVGDTTAKYSCVDLSDFFSRLQQTVVTEEGDTTYQLFLSSDSQIRGRYSTQYFAVRRWDNSKSSILVFKGQTTFYTPSGPTAILSSGKSGVSLYVKTDSNIITQFNALDGSVLQRVPCYSEPRFMLSQDGKFLQNGELWYDITRRIYIDSLEYFQLWLESSHVQQYRDSLTIFTRKIHPVGFKVYAIRSHTSSNIRISDTVPDVLPYFHDVSWTDVDDGVCSPDVHRISFFLRATRQLTVVESAESLVQVWHCDRLPLVTFLTSNDTLHIYNYAKKSTIRSFYVKGSSFVVDSTGSRIYIVRGGKLQVVSCSSGNLVAEVDVNTALKPTTVKILRDSLFIIDAGIDQQFGYIVNLSRKVALRLADIYESKLSGRLASIEFHELNNSISIISYPFNHRVFSVSTGEVLSQKPQINAVSSARWLDVSNDGRLVNILGYAQESNAIVQINTQDWSMRQKTFSNMLGSGSNLYTKGYNYYAVSYVLNNRNAVLLLDAVTLDSVAVIARDTDVRLLDCSMESNLIAISNSSRAVEVFDVATMHSVAIVQAPDAITSAKFFPDCDSMLISTYGGSFGIVDIKNNKVTLRTDSVFRNSVIERIGKSGRFAICTDGLFDIRLNRLSGVGRYQSTVEIHWNGLYHSDSLFNRSVEGGCVLANPFTLESRFVQSEYWTYCHENLPLFFNLSKAETVSSNLTNEVGVQLGSLVGVSVKDETSYSRSGHSGQFCKTFAWSKDGSTIATIDSDNVITIYRPKALITSDITASEEIQDSMLYGVLVWGDECSFHIENAAEIVEDVRCVNAVGQKFSIKFTTSSNTLTIKGLSYVTSGTYTVDIVTRQSSRMTRRLEVIH